MNKVAVKLFVPSLQEFRELDMMMFSADVKGEKDRAARRETK